MRILIAFIVLSALAVGCGGGGQTPNPFTAAFEEFAVPVASNDPGAFPPGCWPDDITGDGVGNIWFAQHHSNEIGKMTPAGVYTGYPVPSNRSYMDGIAFDSVHQLIWVTQTDGNKLVRVDMATGGVLEIPYIRADASPGDLAMAPNGIIWFTVGYEGGGRPGGIARIDPANNQITEIAMPGPRGGFDGIIVTPSGDVWFVELHDNKIGRYSGGVVTEFTLPRPGVVPTNIAMDAAGILWVTEQGGNAIAQFDPLTRVWTEYQVPTAGSLPAGICVDAAGNKWFTCFGSNKIGLLPAGRSTVVDFLIPTPNSGPEDVKIVGGKVTFTEQYGNKIGTITVSGL